MNNFLLMLKFETSDNKKYETEAIQDNAVNVKEAKRHLQGLVV